MAIPLQQAPPAAAAPFIFQQQPAASPAAAPRVVFVQGTAPAPTGGQPTVIQVPQLAAGNLPPSVAVPQPMGAQPGIYMGLTESEARARNIEIAHANNVGAPQDFKPFDDNPNRMYWLRDLDGNYSVRDRRTIDQLGCRWYITAEGSFYAV